MDPLLLQKQLHDNNTDLQDYYKDIQSWGEEMKRKEAALKQSTENVDVPLPHRKISKKENQSDIAEIASIATTSKVPKDFSYWEKFDADAECEKIDKSQSEDESDLTDEYDEAAIELAQQVKEEGNKFVKAGFWKDALKCYTEAISHFNYDPTFYANRALCHLKLGQYKNAEADCTIAIQLDEKYVKALHRRALAKEALQQLKEATEDLERVLVLEPENKESQKLLDKITKILKPVKTTESMVRQVESNIEHPMSKFTASRQNKSVTSTSTKIDEDVGPAFKDLVVEHKKPQVTKSTAETERAPPQKGTIPMYTDVLWPSGSESDIEIVKTFYKAPKDRSRLPLKRISIQETMISRNSN